MLEQIDFVLTWVDGNDLTWQKEKEKYNSAAEPRSGNNVRYRDWENLQFWFRGVEKYAPWARKIHFITSGHYPVWLNREHPKLNLVKHSDYMPDRYLPTFSSRPIELNLHRVVGLSENFIFFNDDMFLTKNVKPDDFFMNGMPCDQAVLNVIISSTDTISSVAFNNMKIINQAFKKSDVVRKNWRKWFTLKYRDRLLRTLLLMPWRAFSGFYDAHLPSSFLKSTFEEIWDRYPDILEQTSQSRFRDVRDVNQWLMCYWQICSGNFYPRPRKMGQFFSISNDNQAICCAIKKQKYKMLCLNDGENIEDFTGAKQDIIAAFCKILPQKSGFEL